MNRSDPGNADVPAPAIVRTEETPNRRPEPEPGPGGQPEPGPDRSAETGAERVSHGSSIASRFRPHVFADGLRASAAWTGRSIVVLAGLVILWFLVKALWSIVLPTLFALLLASVLWPVNRILRLILPKVLAALVTVLAFLGAVVGIAVLTVPAIAAGVAELSELAQDNIADLVGFVDGTPLNLPALDLASLDLDRLVETGLDQVQANAGNILTGITAGLSELTSGTIVVLLTLVFTFFSLKDGDRFLPWTARWTNSEIFAHAARIAAGTWKTLAQYIFAQATVALVDAVFIGLGLVLLNIPLAIPLAVLVFFSAFIPVLGAIASGLIATLVAFLAYGWVTALIVLGIVVLVQQVESNFIQPLLVGRTLEIHPAVVLASVTAGGTLFGIVGAFLAVPTTAVAIVVLRYLRDLSVEKHSATGVPGG